MSYRVPSLDEMHGFLVAFWKALFPQSNVGTRFTYHWKRLLAYAGGATDVNANTRSAQDDVMPDTATGSFLTRWGDIVGVEKKGATGARGTNALRAYGSVAAAVAPGDELTHGPTGLRFEVTEAGVVPGGGTYIDVDIAAIDTGAVTRLNAGETLTFVAPPAGIMANALLVATLDQDGYDAEQDGAYSVRVNDELGKPRMGGSQDDFVKWALEVVGVSSAYAYPNRAGVGTIDVVALHEGNGTARSLSPTERDEVLAHIQEVAPAQIGGSGGGLRVLETLADPQNVEITIQTNGDEAYAFDWIDASEPEVLAYTPASRTVQLTAARPSSMLAGQRVVFRGVGSAQDGRVFTIETLVSTDSFTLKETPAVNPAATDVVYAGGPLTAIIRDAIVAHMNGEIVYADKGVPLPASVAESQKKSVGLKVLAEGIGPANPGGVYGEWNGGLIRAVLGAIAVYPTGARNVTIITPASDYEATDPVFPNDDQINFIAPSAVLVRGSI